MALILIIEDEKLLRWALTEQLSRAGHAVHAAGDLAEATEHLRKHQPDVLLLDLSLPDGHGLDFYEQHESQLDDSVVIVMTAVGQIEDAVRAMKLGALDFLNKPVDQAELVRMVERSLTVRSDQLEAQASRQSRERTLHQDLVAESPAFRKVLQVAEDVAQSEVGSILLLGESGSGKNVLAREIHAHSARKDKPLIEVPCAAIPDQLLESELLGHERGAFTDAKTTRKGAFELADGGTVVLDEIGELKLELQAKLLHVLEERRLRRVGGSREIFVDVRVIAPPRAPGRHPAAGAVFPRSAAGEVRAPLRGVQSGRRELSARLLLAGQRARAAQRHRARHGARAQPAHRAGLSGPRPAGRAGRRR
jgi:DNA-binding NtrC family response regulator